MPILSMTLALAAAAAPQRPPREQSPVPQDVLAPTGAGNSDEELARAIAADADRVGGRAERVGVGGGDRARELLIAIAGPGRGEDVLRHRRLLARR
jgi:hypothetical protein